MPERKYKFILGNKSIDLFNYYKVDEIHGLTREECSNYKENSDDAYIAGMANVSPNDSTPYVFINKSRLKGDYRDVTLVMHELMHMSLILHQWTIRDNEEKIITWAEEETNRIIKKMNNLN